MNGRTENIAKRVVETKSMVSTLKREGIDKRWLKGEA